MPSEAYRIAFSGCPSPCCVEAMLDGLQTMLTTLLERGGYWARPTGIVAEDSCDRISTHFCVRSDANACPVIQELDVSQNRLTLEQFEAGPVAQSHWQLSASSCLAGVPLSSRDLGVASYELSFNSTVIFHPNEPARPSSFLWVSLARRPADAELSCVCRGPCIRGH